MQQQSEPMHSPYVVDREEIPLSAPTGSGRFQRSFAAHPSLAGALSATAAKMSWWSLNAGQYLETRGDGETGLVLVLSGEAELVGGTRRRVERGDVITLPAHHEYGFRALAAGGFEALHISFRPDVSARTLKEVTLEDLIAQNQARLNAWLNTGYFRMLQDGTLDSPPVRARFKNCLRVFSDFFQTLLFTRQAMCRDESYRAAFGEHLSEEFGHNVLMKAGGDPVVVGDPRLQATLSWFCYQMLVLDNAGKAIINLVLESGGYHFHNLAKPAFMGDDVEEYFSTHAEDDERHQDLGLELLEGLEPGTYRVLQLVLNEAWDMLGATTQRILELVRREQGLS